MNELQNFRSEKQSAKEKESNRKKMKMIDAKDKEMFVNVKNARANIQRKIGRGKKSNYKLY